MHFHRISDAQTLISKRNAQHEEQTLYLLRGFSARVNYKLLILLYIIIHIRRIKKYKSNIKL